MGRTGVLRRPVSRRRGLLRGDGDAGGNVVLDRQVFALKREAHTLLREPVGLLPKRLAGCTPIGIRRTHPV